MITEYVLLALLTLGLIGTVVAPSQDVFRHATPQLAVRMEKYLMTGYKHNVSHCSFQAISCWEK